MSGQSQYQVRRISRGRSKQRQKQAGQSFRVASQVGGMQGWDQVVRQEIAGKSCTRNDKEQSGKMGL